MSLARKAAMPALWAEISEAVEIGGTKALKIAFYDIERLPDIMRVISANAETPGMAGVLLQAARIKDARGHQRPVLIKGKAKKLACDYTLKCTDLTRGIAWEQMAELAELSPHDTRLRPLCKAISEAALKAWGMELGWFRGRFRVLTALQSAEKETKLLKYNVVGGARRGEKKRRIADNKALPVSEVTNLQITLFEGLNGEIDDLLN